MCRLDIGMKLPSWLTCNFSTSNFQDVLMPKTSLIVVKRIIQKLLILALVVYMLSMASGVEATDWFLNEILKAMWKIFDNSPARQDTYIKICEVDEFPMRY